MFSDFEVVMVFSKNALIVADSLQQKCSIFPRDDVLSEFTGEVT